MKLAIHEIFIFQGGCKMNQEEFYYEGTNPKRVKIICAILVILFVIAVVAFIYIRNTYTLTVKSKVIVELGSEVSTDIRNYVENRITDESDYTLNLKGVSISDNKYDLVGEYQYRVNYKSITKKGKIIVKDTTPPEVEVTDMKVGVGETIEPDEFIKVCTDYSRPCRVEVNGESIEDLVKKAGTYTVNLVISDQYNNKVTKSASLEVKKGYSRMDMIQSDLNIDHIDENVDDFKNVMYIKYSKALSPHDFEHEEEYQELAIAATSSLYDYLPEEYKLNRVDDFVIFPVFNKYGYVVGVAIRVTLDNGKTMYLSK